MLKKPHTFGVLISQTAERPQVKSMLEVGSEVWCKKNSLTHFAHPFPKFYRGLSDMSPRAVKSSSNQQLNIITIIN